MSLASAAARRYAEAFVESAAAKGDQALSTLRDEFNGLAKVLDEIPELADLMLNPAVTVEERGKALDQVMANIGLSDLTQRCLKLLSEKDRIGEIREIAKTVDALADERAGREQAFVTSAIEMSEGAIDQLRRALEKRTGKKIQMNVSVDPALIGGIRAEVGSYVLDGTIRTELERLRVALENQDRA